MLLTLSLITFLSAAGAVMVNLASQTNDAMGDVRRMEQLRTCARAGLETQIARLPNPTAASNYSLTPALTLATTHYDTTNDALTNQPYVTTATVSPDTFTIMDDGNNMANVLSAGGGTGGVGSAGGRKAYRMVTTCQNGTLKHEAESLVIYGLAR